MCLQDMLGMSNTFAEGMLLAKDGSSVKAAKEQAKPRTYLSQQDVPSASVENALKVPRAIGDNFGYKPTTPLQVAAALDLSPTSSGFRMLTGAAIAYGLTSGGYNADQISLSPLGLRIIRPTAEGDELTGKREALLKPRVIREFLEKYDRSPVPREDIGCNVLMGFGVPKERTKEVLDLILEGAELAGFLHEIKGKKYIELSRPISTENAAAERAEQSDAAANEENEVNERGFERPATFAKAIPTSASDPRSRRVFITHGKNHALIEPIKKLLAFGELEAVVSVQTQTVSQGIPDKVMEEMRSCGAAIIHVDQERILMDAKGEQHVGLNDNVLIEIGAALALYGQKRFILVVKDGVKLPSNLQGLLELRYNGETLDMPETVKLMEAINDMKKRGVPVQQMH